MDKCSIIVPCYNEELALPLFYKEANKVLGDMKIAQFEYVFVDDGSSDKTLEVIKDLAQSDPRVRYVSFSRNFGKEAAMYAGLKAARGNYVAVMDADLQDPPSLLPEMYTIVKSGTYDCAATRRVNRKGEPAIRSFFARCFYKLINKISRANIVDGARDFRLMNRKMVDAILSLEEYNRFSKGIFGWVGFKTKWLEYENTKRVAGETKWSFWKLLIYSLEGIIAFSTAPLAVASVLGILLFVIAIVMVVIVFMRAIFWADPVSGWPSLMCVIVFIGGIQLLCTGIIGSYLSKTYLEVKKRPIYIVGDTNVCEECENDQ